MSRVARYARILAHPGNGDELAGRLVAAADEMEEDPGCELYLVSRQAGDPDVVWVTELWRSEADLERALERIRADPGVAETMALAAKWKMIDLDLAGGKGPGTTTGGDDG